MMYFRILILLFIFFSLAPDSRSGEFDFPPLWSVEKGNPITNVPYRLRYAGPLGEKIVSSEEPLNQMTAFRPFYSSFTDSANRIEGMDFLWPASVWRESRFRDFEWVLLYYGSRETDGRYKNYVWPFWFSGRDAGGWYGGFFPFYGDIRDFLTYDRMRFVLFPVYWQTIKGNSSGESWFWPFVNWDESPRFKKFRVFPFYAYNHRYGSEYHRSILWPLWNTLESRNPAIPGYGWMVFPLLGYKSWMNEDAWSCLCPFFYYARTPHSFRVNAPWPVFRYGKDSVTGGEIFFLFPFWGKRTTPSYDFRFYVWPLGIHRKDWNDMVRTEGIWILPFYWSRAKYECAPDGSSVRRLMYYRRFYPFVSLYEKEDEFRITALDASPVHYFPAVSRNLNPLFRVYSYESNRKGASWDLLWGMLRTWQTEMLDSSFSFAPFYEVRWNIMNKTIAETEAIRGDKAPPTAFQQYEYDVERRFLFGMVNVKSSDVLEDRWKLFWSLEF